MEFKQVRKPIKKKPEPASASMAEAEAPVSRSVRFSRSIFTKKTAGITAVVVLILAGYYFVQSYTGASGPDKAILDPGYQTILPSGKSIQELGGWRRISPPEKDPVYAYSDAIDNVSISVSQQPLPVSFTPNTNEHVAELAKKFNATTKIESEDATAYLGTSAKGPQSVIFSKKNVLILIKSQQKIETSSWQRYINSLNTNRY